MVLRRDSETEAEPVIRGASWLDGGGKRLQRVEQRVSRQPLRAGINSSTWDNDVEAAGRLEDKN